jgi:DNA-binding IclR family transcriptional regulator
MTDLRVREALRQMPKGADVDIDTVLDDIRKRGYESAASMQVRGLHAISFPIFDTRNRALAALTVPYAERLDEPERKTIADVERALGQASRRLSERMGWREGAAQSNVPGLSDQRPVSDMQPRRRRRSTQSL